MRWFSILLVLLSTNACRTETPGFVNLDFEDVCDEASTGICGWEIAYQARCDVLADSTPTGSALLIDGRGGVCFVEQILQLPENFEASVLSMSASISTQNLEGRGSGLNLGVYDADSLLIANADMGYSNYNYVQGNSNWLRKEIKVVVPDNAASTRLGVISFGSGEARFDSVRFQFDPLKGRKPSEYAIDYVTKAITIAEENSLNKDSVDFDHIKNRALQIAGDAQNGDEMATANRYILASLKDHHSFLMTASDRDRWLNNDGQSDVEIVHATSSRNGDYGVLWIPGFHGNDDDSKVEFATRLQQQIRDLYNQGIKGWIVDLRDNDGGNMAPMLAGLEPLFESDTLGFLVDVNGEKEAWGRGEAIRLADGEDFVSVRNPVTLDEFLPVAVLYDESTGSSGEIVIISFIGRRHTASFGKPSMGLTTGNGEFELPDGSYFLMASTRMADRNGNVFVGSIVPDYVIEGDEDPRVEAAEWLDRRAVR